MKSRRPYTQSVRAQRAQETEQRIVEAADQLVRQERYDRITLQRIADDAGVTIPTVQRRFGNKEGVFAAHAERLRARVYAQRGTPPVGDVRAAVRQLVAHYEQEGPLMWQFLRQEADVPALQEALPEARAVHRAWVTAVFGQRSRAATDALVAATDLFVWKLLRVDLGRTRRDTEQTMTAMALAVAGEYA